MPYFTLYSFCQCEQASEYLPLRKNQPHGTRRLALLAPWVTSGLLLSTPSQLWSCSYPPPYAVRLFLLTHTFPSAHTHVSASFKVSDPSLCPSFQPPHLDCSSLEEVPVTTVFMYQHLHWHFSVLASNYASFLFLKYF